MRRRFAFVQPKSTGSPVHVALTGGSVNVSASLPSANTNLVLFSAEADHVRLTWEGSGASTNYGLRICKDLNPFVWRGPTGSLGAIGESPTASLDIGWFQT